MNPDEKKILEEQVKRKSLRHSQPREKILEMFVNANKHLTVQELYFLVKKKYPDTGLATVYRTLKLICEAGLCREVRFEDGIARYEFVHEGNHHDHLICIKCGRVEEIYDPEIERLQDKIYKKYKFIPHAHNLELYGICDKCSKKHLGGSK